MTGSSYESFSLFTTIRFTWPYPRSSEDTTVELDSDPSKVGKTHVPLVDRHIARLRTAHKHYVDAEGEAKWGRWAGDEAVWDEVVRPALQARADEGPGDYRVRRPVYIFLDIAPAVP